MNWKYYIKTTKTININNFVVSELRRVYKINDKNCYIWSDVDTKWHIVSYDSISNAEEITESEAFLEMI